MPDAYAAVLYNTSALWIAAINAATATKVIAAGTYKQNDKVIFYTVIAA